MWGEGMEYVGGRGIAERGVEVVVGGSSTAKRRAWIRCGRSIAKRRAAGTT